MSTVASPRGQSGDASADYIETHLQIREDVHYSKEMDRFLPEADEEVQKVKVAALWSKTADDQTKLFKAMKAYQEMIAKKDPSAARIDLQKCTWLDVVGEFEQAKEFYKVERRRKGVSGAITNCFRKLGENADAFGQWISLLPNGDYGAGICGALKLVLGAIRRMDDVRHAVYQGVEDIPEAVSRARRYRQIYSDVKAYQLSQKSAAFFSSVLKAFEQIIIVLTEPGWIRTGKSILKGEGYSVPIIESIEKVKLYAIEIEKEAELCFEARLRKMDEQQEFISQRQEQMDERQKKMSEQQKHMNELQEEMNERQKKMDERDKKNSEVMANLYHRLLLSSPILDPRTRKPYPLAIEESPTNDVAAAPAKAPKKSPKRIKPAPPKALTATDILNILDHSLDLSLPSADIAHCRLDGEKLSLADKDLVSHIARSDALRGWLLNAKESASLLVLGNTADANAFTSPLSFLVAELASLYADTGASVAVSYFCGLHADARWEAFADARGLVGSLLAQVLGHEGFKLELAGVGEGVVEGVGAFEIGALCDLFREVVLRIREPVMLLCFVDTVSIYETRSRAQGTRAVLEMLRELVVETGRQREEKKEGVVFKVLVTDPGRSCAAMELFEEEETFVVEGFIDGARQGVVVMEGLEPL